MPAPYLGNCLCGRIRFRLNAEPVTLYACHCTDCQRRSGGALLLSMWVHRDALEVLQGTPTLVSSIANDSRERKNQVCAACQVRLWSEPVNRPRFAILRPGLLEEAKRFAPIAHQFVRSALPWFVFPDGVPRYETTPDDPAELARLWKQATSKLSVHEAPPGFSDWPALLQLLRASFAYMQGRIDPPSSMDRLGLDELRAKSQHESVIIATDGGALVGCAFAAVRSDCVYIGKAAVASTHRGRGIARLMFGVVEQIARRHGLPTLELQTRVELTENHRTFAALGFEKVAETAHPGHDRPTSITMRKRTAP